MDNAKRKGSPVKGKRAKKLKKQDGIKKPTSAYLYFVSDYRMVLKKKGENISRVQDVAKLCGEAWKSMSAEEKEPYSQKYNTDRARYLKEKEAYDRKMGKDPNKPKRPQTAYFFFLADFRKEMANKPLPDGKKIPTLAGERWKLMTDSDKLTYEKMVEKDKARYEKEMTEWRKQNPEQPKKPVSRKKVVPVQQEESEDSEDDDDDDDDEDDSEEEEEESESDSD